MKYESCCETMGVARNLNTKSKMAEGRFAQSGEIVVDQLKLNAKNKNTTKSTQTWLNVWEKWGNERKFNPKLEEDEDEDLNKKLQMLYAEVRTKDGIFYNRKCRGNLVHVVILQRTTSNCFKLRTARARRLFFLTRPIKFLVVAVDGSLMLFYGCNCSCVLVFICIENYTNRR